MKQSSVQARVLQVAGILVLATLVLQFLIFEKASVEGYFYWPLLVGFVAIVMVLAPIKWKNMRDD